MGIFDSIKQASNEAKKHASKISKDIKDQLDDEFSDNESYQKFKGSSSSALNTSKEIGKGVKGFAKEVSNKVGKTEFGKNIGETSRSISAKLSELPVFSITSDIVKEKNGVNFLLEHLKKNPNDPERYIWLAEAMIRSKIDVQNYSRIRSAVDPSYFMVKSTVQSLNELGKVEKDPVTTKLLKTSFLMSINRIEKNPRDSNALYCLARIYYCEGDTSEAIKFAKLSFLAKQNALSFILLAKCYLSLKQLNNAHRAANRAIKFKNTYGNKIIAECNILDDQNTMDSLNKIKKYSILIDKVKTEDKAKYNGPHASSISLLEGVGTKQWNRIVKLME